MNLIMEGKMVKKILILAVMLIMALGLLVGCGGNKLPYNAVMYGNVYEVRSFINDDFYNENLTYNAWSKTLGDYVKDDTNPEFRTVIVKEQEKFDKVFKEFPVEVDFEKDMVLMHCFTTASSGEYEIKSFDINEQVLSVKYKTVASKGITPPNASNPLAKWIVVKMDKLDITTAEFIF